MADGSEMKMRKRILRVHVHRATLGIYISRDRRTIIIIIIIIIYIQFAHSCTVYVGLAQARPNYQGKDVCHDSQRLLYDQLQYTYPIIHLKNLWLPQVHNKH